MSILAIEANNITKLIIKNCLTVKKNCYIRKERIVESPKVAFNIALKYCSHYSKYVGSVYKVIYEQSSTYDFRNSQRLFLGVFFENLSRYKMKNQNKAIKQSYQDYKDNCSLETPEDIQKSLLYIYKNLEAQAIISKNKKPLSFKKKALRFSKNISKFSFKVALGALFALGVVSCLEDNEKGLDGVITDDIKAEQILAKCEQINE